MTPSDRQEVEDLKAHVDLVELVRQSGLELKRKGKNWLCRCPFHDDETASLSVSGKLWNRFACKAEGDAFSWLQLKEKLPDVNYLPVLTLLKDDTLVSEWATGSEHLRVETDRQLKGPQVYEGLRTSWFAHPVFREIHSLL